MDGSAPVPGRPVVPGPQALPGGAIVPDDPHAEGRPFRDPGLDSLLGLLVCRFGPGRGPLTIFYRPGGEKETTPPAGTRGRFASYYPDEVRFSGKTGLLTILFAGLGIAVLGWRVLAYRDPAALVPIPDGLRLPLAAFGIVFAGCGLAAWLLRPGPATALFALVGLGGGVHWGGSIGAASGGTELALFFVYLAATALGEAALLNLSLTYGRHWITRTGVKALLYLPAAVAAVLAPAAPVLPEQVLQTAAGILLLFSTLSGIAAGVIFIVRFARAHAGTRRRDGLGIIVATMIAGFALSTLGAGGVLPGPGEAWNLANVLIPAGLLFALVRRR